MILYTAQTVAFGYVFSNLVVTFPPDKCPKNIVQVSLDGATLFRDYPSYYVIRRGEIPTTLPYKTVVQMSYSAVNGFLLLANEDFYFNPHDNITLNTLQITLACMNTNIELPSDGLHYLVNLFDKNSVRAKDFVVLPYIYDAQDSIPSNSKLQALIETRISDLDYSAPDSKSSVRDSDLLSFSNIATSYFKTTPQHLLLHNQKNGKTRKNFGSRAFGLLTKWHDLYLSVDYRGALNLLESLPNLKPNIIKSEKANTVLLRSILISNWLMTPNDYSKRQIAARLINRFRLRLRNQQENIALNVWTGNWEDVGWMGRIAISWANERKNQDGANKTILLIRRRTNLFVIYPLFFWIFSLGWLTLVGKMPSSGFLPLGLFASTFLIPRLYIGIMYSAAKLKLETPVKLMATYGFILGGLTSQIELGLFNPLIAAFLIVLVLWLIWSSVPMTSKIGKFLFDCLVLAVPLMSIGLGAEVWNFYITFMHFHFLELISNLLVLLSSSLELTR